MRSFSDLLTGRIRSNQDPELYAAGAVAAANQALREWWDTADARAVSFRRGIIMVGVRHSTVAGQIQQRQGELIVSINRLLSQRFPGAHQPVAAVATQLSTTSSL